MSDNQFYQLKNMDVLAKIVSDITKVLQGDVLYEVVLRPFKSKRSLAQNSLYWLWLTEISSQIKTADGKLLDKEEWHYLCGLKFIGVKSFDVAGKTYVTPMKSTTKLTTKEFTDYLMQIEAEFLSRGAGLTFPDAYELAMNGTKQNRVTKSEQSPLPELPPLASSQGRDRDEAPYSRQSA